MKKILIGIALLSIAATASNRLPLYLGFLQTDFDGNQHSITNLNNLTISGTTNQITFGATNTPPASTNPVVWISVNITGDTNAYRLGLCK